MKNNIIDGIERHVVYFLTGFVAILSAILVLFFLYLFMLGPIVFFGNLYLLVVPVMIVAMYYLGRRIMKSIE